MYNSTKTAPSIGGAGQYLQTTGSRFQGPRYNLFRLNLHVVACTRGLSRLNYVKDFGWTDACGNKLL
eukprot:3851583-Prymnesium_polylepis.1